MSLESLSINELNLSSTVNKFPSATDGTNSARDTRSLTSIHESAPTKNVETPDQPELEPDWREQMKQIIARNLRQRDAYADKHEIQANKPQRQIHMLRRPEEPTAAVRNERKRQLVAGGRANHAGSAHSMGQFYCAPTKAQRLRMTYNSRRGESGQAPPRRVSETPRQRDARRPSADHQPRRAYRRSPAPTSPRQQAHGPARGGKPRFPCVLLDHDRRRSSGDWGKAVSALCIDSVLDD